LILTIFVERLISTKILTKDSSITGYEAMLLGK